MLGISRQRDYEQEGYAREPLLNENDEILSAHDSDDILFSVGDDEPEDSSPLSSPDSSQPKTGHSVRFQEDVQVIGPPLRSTFQSREAEYELDTDDLDGETLVQLETAQQHRPQHTGRHREQSVPLLVGLLDSASARRSADGSLQLEHRNPNGDTPDENVDLDALAAKQLAGGGMLDSIANMANSILGAGIIGLPYAVRQAGFVMGILLLVILCAVTDWTIRLIVINAKLSGRNSYIEIMHYCFGSSGRAAVSFFQFAFAFGGMCAFGIIIGDTIPHVIRSVFPNLYSVPVLSLLTKRQFVIALCTIVVSYPLSLYRDIHKLARASALALVGMIIIVIAVLVDGPRVAPELKGDQNQRFTVLGPGVFQAIGVISFAFVCHHNSLLIYGSLRTPTMDRFAKVTHISTLVSLVACCTLAISAYLVFTNKTQGNILNNFAPVS
ncbi:hypothetical protein AcW1_009038 [Taiwanofungus camphoratus]|nr:hypothetical protein AcV5_007061 [Antrodia cinnamomea]KAI0949418.1 hypothetical protein AcW1_009038 [Antrodia cinnamomea]KAI0958777.1 hypothetical protein AcV7_004492 [Antrodia cinnamomea]